MTLHLVAMQELHHLLADQVQVSAQVGEHPGRHAFTFTDQAEQDVLGADVVVAELQRLAQRELEHLLRTRRERNMAARGFLSPADNLLDLLPYGGQADPERFQGLGRHALAFLNQAEQDVLGADVVVVESPGLVLGQDHDPARPVGEPLEHVRAPTVGVASGSRAQARTCPAAGKITSRGLRNARQAAGCPG